MIVEFARAEGASIHEFAVENALKYSSSRWIWKVIGRFGRDMINGGDPHQIAGLFDTFDHNIQLILNGRDRIPELTAEYRIQIAFAYI